MPDHPLHANFSPQRPRRARLALPALLLFAATIFSLGITWGLPSRSIDPFLFGDRLPWTGQQILSLAPGWGDDANRAADVAAHPLTNRDKPIWLNQTNAHRATIIRRYRLYSDQPDEMITLRALAQMQPGNLRFDPKLYQYGGLWIYPIGAILKLASLLHLITLTPDLAFYLNHPDAFARLYVVMRLYSVAWGLIGVAVIYSLVRRLTRSTQIATFAALCYTLLPTVINAAHEAKPHLAGAVLGLIAIDCALRAIQTNKRPWSLAAGLACGAAGGMVLSECLILGVLPVMSLLMHAKSKFPLQPGAEAPRSAPNFKRRLTLAIPPLLIALSTYSLSNPYVILHLLTNRTLLQSNLGNSAAMYQLPASIAGTFHGLLLIFTGSSIIAFFGLWVLLIESTRKRPTAWLLLAAILPQLIFFLMHATGKPGEYARFALQAEVLLILAVALGIAVMKRPIERLVIAGVLLALLLPLSISYILNYTRETLGTSTRHLAAVQLNQLAASGATTLAIDVEPAPYSLPPVDLFHWKLLLLPRDAQFPADAGVRIDAVDYAGKKTANMNFVGRPIFMDTPLSWAAKPFRIESPPNAAAAAPAQN
jgi:hypothetical protein